MQNKAKVNIGKMNISAVTTKYYDKNREQSTTNVFKTKPNKAKVKIGKMSISVATTKHYEKISVWTLGENKPNSKPIKANLHFTAENAEYAEKKGISVSDCSIERYALYPISPCSLRTRRLMENKANQSQFSNRKTDDKVLMSLTHYNYLRDSNGNYVESSEARNPLIIHLTKSEFRESAAAFSRSFAVLPLGLK
jgi:hypothetical protein